MEFANSANDSEWIAMLNSSLAELYEILISKRDAGYFETDTTFTLTDSNLQAYPSDFKELVALDYQVGSSYYSVRRYVNQDRNIFNHSGPLSSNKMYRLVQAGIRIIPESSAAGIYRMSYVPRYLYRSDLSNTIDDLDLDVWHEYVVVDCAIKFLTKQETDAAIFMAQKSELKQRINSSANNRDNNEPYRLNPSHDDYVFYQDGSTRRY